MSYYFEVFCLSFGRPHGLSCSNQWSLPGESFLEGLPIKITCPNYFHGVFEQKPNEQPDNGQEQKQKQLLRVFDKSIYIYIYIDIYGLNLFEEGSGSAIVATHKVSKRE